MSVPAVTRGVRLSDWLAMDPAPGRFPEIVNGELVTRRIGGNPHHHVAWRLAYEFERQWPDTVASAPGNWVLRQSADGTVLLGRMPDVLVNGAELLTSDAYRAVPSAAIEVWSPANTLAGMNSKRREYREAGLPVLVEAYLTDTGDVHLEWLVNQGTRWCTAAAATGDGQLEVDDPHVFKVVPNALLRRPDQLQAEDPGTT